MTIRKAVPSLLALLLLLPLTGCIGALRCFGDPGFILSVTPQTLTIAQGSSGTATIVVNPPPSACFPQTLHVEVLDPPAGIRVEPITFTRGTEELPLVIRVDEDTKPGPVTLRFLTFRSNTTSIEVIVESAGASGLTDLDVKVKYEALWR